MKLAVRCRKLCEAPRALSTSATDTALRWRKLCEAPRIWVSVRPLVSSAVCAKIVAAIKPALEAQSENGDSSASDVDYRSLPVAACGQDVMQLIKNCGVLDTAAAATGIASRPGEDIMVARTKAVSAGSHGILNMHHDRHKHDTRVATFMLYLSTVDAAAGHGGETYFPAADAPRSDELATALRDSYRSGARFLAADSSVAAQVEERLRAWRAGGGAGVGSSASAGTALLFDAASSDEDVAAAWHAPCAVSGPDAKYTLTIFKSPPPLWSSVLLG